jgi:mono/diheme cytochrome c family protein
MAMQIEHALVASMLLVAASCRRAPQIAENKEVVSREAEKRERGRHLATIGGCFDCHSPGGMHGAADPGRALSGSEIGWRGPWGTSYAANLTPDPETGIGDWTEDDIVRAMRTGVSKSGRKILPPMPWQNYAQLSDDDAYALAAYLKSLPPIAHHVPQPLPPEQQSGVAIVIPPPPPWGAPKGSGVGGGPPSDH